MDFDITSLLSNKSSESKDAKTNGKTTKKVSPLNFFKVNRKIQCIHLMKLITLILIMMFIFHDSFFSLLFSVHIMYVLYSLLPNHFLYHLLSAHLFDSIYY